MQDYIEKLMDVSILVLLEWSSEDGHRCHALCAGLKVSILVLLEWSSEDIEIDMHDIKRYSFNPCSIGMVF